MSRIRYRIKAVIFDMDGVITNTMPDHYRAWRTVLLGQGIHASYHDIYSREGQQGMQSLKEIYADHNRTITNAVAKQLLREKEERFKKVKGLRYIAGARTFIRDLERRGFQLALVTGTALHEVKRILPISLQKRFSAIVTGTDVKSGKPHPEPFLQALKRMNIKAKQAVVIENAPLGIRSAKKAGLRCLALETSLSRDHLGQADAVFKSVKQLTNNVRFELAS